MTVFYFGGSILFRHISAEISHALGLFWNIVYSPGFVLVCHFHWKLHINSFADKSVRLYPFSQVPTFGNTRSSADADNGLDAFVGQSRSTNISGPFQVK